MGSNARKPYRCTMLIDALRLLAVQPMRDRDELGQARHCAACEGVGDVHGVAVSHDDLEQLFIQDFDGAPRISREGARVLLELFREGVLEVSREKRAKGGFELLEAYAQGRASIIGPGYWAKPRRSKRNRLTARPTIERSVTRDVLSTPYDRTYQVTMHRLL
jgi:hypothetical protein